jgi:predicted peptidase
MPQCLRGTWWWPNPDMEAQVLLALEQSVAEFNGDPNRLYLTGISMGGYGTWSLAYQHPGKFAALVPVCGGIQPPGDIPTPEEGPFAHPELDPYAATAEKVGPTPVWIFHGEADRAVPVEESRKMEEALKKAGGNVRYSEYPGVGHNSWDRAYAEPELIRWLMRQRKPRN